MIYGFTYSTDMRSPCPRRKTFSTVKQALGWLNAGMLQFSHANPEEARNWHRDLREVYEMPKGWSPRLKRVKLKVAKRISYSRGSIYSEGEDEALWNVIREEGTKLQ